MENKQKIPNKNSFLHLFSDFFENLESYESDFITKSGFKYLLLSRLISFIAMLVFIYLICTVVIAFLITLNLVKFNNENLILLGLVIAFPLITYVSINFKNKNFLLSKSIKNFINVLKFLLPNIDSLRWPVEIFLFITFVTLYTSFQFALVGSFAKENTKIIDFLYSGGSLLIFPTISIVIYAILRIFGVPEDTLEDRFRKSKRIFLLWTFGTVITFVYMVYTFTLLKDNFIIHLPYQVIVILLAIEKSIDSYKKMTNYFNQLFVND